MTFIIYGLFTFYNREDRFRDPLQHLRAYRYAFEESTQIIHKIRYKHNNIVPVYHILAQKVVIYKSNNNESGLTGKRRFIFFFFFIQFNSSCSRNGSLYLKIPSL